MATLSVYFEQRRVGTIDIDKNGPGFTYDTSWMGLRGAFPISITMPLRSERIASDTFLPWAANLLPESEQLRTHGLDGPGVVDGPTSAHSVVLVAADGRRIVYPHLSVINAVQYPQETFATAVRDADLAVLTNTDFVRALLPDAVLRGVPVAVASIGSGGLAAACPGRGNSRRLRVAGADFVRGERARDPARAAGARGVCAFRRKGHRGSRRRRATTTASCRSTV